MELVVIHGETAYFVHDPMQLTEIAFSACLVWCADASLGVSLEICAGPDSAPTSDF